VRAPLDHLIAQHGTEKFAKKLLGESEIEAVIHRLDRLTQEEGRVTMAQTLEVVHGLVNNVKVVMNGAQKFSGISRRLIKNLPPTDGQSSVDGIWKALGAL
jgi:hypothetical protein